MDTEFRCFRTSTAVRKDLRLSGLAWRSLSVLTLASMPPERWQEPEKTDMLSMGQNVCLYISIQEFNQI